MVLRRARCTCKGRVCEGGSAGLCARRLQVRVFAHLAQCAARLGGTKILSPPGFRATPLDFVSLEVGCARGSVGDFERGWRGSGWPRRAHVGR